MTKPPQNGGALTRFRAAVTEIYGDRIERVVLFGSHARGDANPDSDYDIDVFIKIAGTLPIDYEARRKANKIAGLRISKLSLTMRGTTRSVATQIIYLVTIAHCSCFCPEACRSWP